MDAVPNPNGTPETLVPAPLGNARAARHAVYSDRLREPRALEIADVVLSAPWADECLDAISALELGRILALVERIDEALAERKLGQRTTKLVDQRLAASRRLSELLDRGNGSTVTEPAVSEAARPLPPGLSDADLRRGWPSSRRKFGWTPDDFYGRNA
jgi:hypothetical protein